MGVRLNTRHINESNDEEILDEISLDTSWLDSKTDNSSIEMLDEMDVSDVIPVSKTIDGNRDRFVYDGKQDDSMTEEYFPDIAFEEQTEVVYEEETKKSSSNSNKIWLTVIIIISIVATIVFGALALSYFGVDVTPLFVKLAVYV